MNQLGSYWRWRAALLVLSLCLFAIGWVVLNEWTNRVVVGAGQGTTLVYRVVRRDHQTLQTWDWRTGEQTRVVDFGPEDHRWHEVLIVRDGGSVARQVPFGHRYYSPPIPFEGHGLAGVTPDERYAVYQGRGQFVSDGNGGTKVSFDAPWSGTNPVAYVTYVVDLRTQQVVDTKEWQSTITAFGSSGEFLSQCHSPTPLDPKEPAAATWRITSDGQWEKIGDSQSRFVTGAILPLAAGEGKNLRMLDADEVAAEGETTSQGRFVRYSSASDSLILVDLATQRIHATNLATKRLVPLQVPGIGASSVQFTHDGALVLMSDMRDDLRVIDPTTGVTLFRESSGLRRRTALLAIAIGLAVVWLAWLVLAIRERDVWWAIADALFCNGVWQFALIALFHSEVHRDMAQFGTAKVALMMSIVLPVIGAAVGNMILLGWYWAHGTHSILRRALVGTVALVLGQIPVAVGMWLNEGEFLATWTGAILLGLPAAGVIAAIVAPIRSIGWTIRDAPVSENPRRFGLATFLSVVAGICVLLALCQTHVEQGLNRMADFLAFVIAGCPLFGGALIAVLFSRFRWPIVALAVVITFVLAGVALDPYTQTLAIPVPSRQVYQLFSAVLFGVAMTVAIPCLVLRAHGFAWVRGGRGAAMESVAPTPASRENPCRHNRAQAPEYLDVLRSGVFKVSGRSRWPASEAAKGLPLQPSLKQSLSKPCGNAAHQWHNQHKRRQTKLRPPAKQPHNRHANQEDTKSDRDDPTSDQHRVALAMVEREPAKLLRQVQKRDARENANQVTMKKQTTPATDLFPCSFARSLAIHNVNSLRLLEIGSRVAM